MTDRVCPMAFVVASAFAIGLIWVFALMAPVRYVAVRVMRFQQPLSSAANSAEAEPR